VHKDAEARSPKPFSALRGPQRSGLVVGTSKAILPGPFRNRSA